MKGRKNQREVRIITPGLIKDDKELYKFFKSRPNQQRFLPNEDYPFLASKNGIAKTVFYQFQTLIVRREGTYFDVLGQPIPGAEGATGKIYPILGTFIPNEDQGMDYCTDKKDSVIKEQSFASTPDFVTRIQKESDISAQLIHLHANTVTVILPSDQKEKAFSYMRLRKFEESLETFLNSQTPPNTLNRLILARQLVRALKEQFHDRGVIHRDIKPSNIMVHKKTKIKFIDAGDSILADTLQRGGIVGTKQYMAPEVFDNILEVTSPTPHQKIDQQSDIASLGLVLARVFGAKPRQMPRWLVDCKAAYKELIRDKGVEPLIDLFEGLTLDPVISESIQNFLENMIHPDKARRPNLEEAFHFFDQIVVEFERNQKIINAHQIGLETYKKLYDLRLERIAFNEESVERIKLILVDNIDKLEDSTEAIQEFMKTVNIKFSSIMPLNSKAELRTAVIEVANGFIDKLENLNTLINKISRDLELLSLAPNLPHVLVEKNKLAQMLCKIQRQYHQNVNKELKFNTIEKINQNFENIERNFSYQYLNFTNSDEAKDFIITYNTIFKELKKPNSGSEKSKKLQGLVKNAISEYIKKTLTNSNLKHKDRAASSRRIDDISKLLTTLNSDTLTEKELSDSIETQLKQIKTGKSVFGLFSIGCRSKLRSSVHKVLMEYKRALACEALGVAPARRGRHAAAL